MPQPVVGLDRYAISGITGSISIVCWIIVFTPQLLENFRRQSAEGLSITFIVLWLAGDVFNVLGSVLQHVLPTMLTLAIYYTLADIVLLWQALVYRSRQRQLLIDASHLSPATPLLVPPPVDPETGSLEDESEPPSSRMRTWLLNCLAAIVVIAAGTLAWWFSSGGKSKTPKHDPGDNLRLDPLGQTFGWLCAILYLGSRFPQIMHNYRRKSCDGISFLFFMFAYLGNATYVISIFAWSLSPRFLLANSSWLAGSLGTMVLDVLILVQFWVYGSRESEEDNDDDNDDDSSSGTSTGLQS